MIYYIVINEEEGTYNIFDEMNLEYIPKVCKVISTIKGDYNASEVLKTIEILRPDLKRSELDKLLSH